MRTIELTDEQLEALAGLLSLALDEQSMIVAETTREEGYEEEEVERARQKLTLGQEVEVILDKAWL